MSRRIEHLVSSKKLLVFFTILTIIIMIAVFAKLNEIRDENKRLKVEVRDLRSSMLEIQIKNNQLKSTNEQLAEHIESRNKAYRAEILNGLADIKTLDPSVIVDLKYASTDNFTKKQVYPDNSRALMRRETAVKLLQAIEIFKKDGYTIKIFDAYRPLSAQKVLWDHSPIPGFIANPDTGSKHNKGASVDMTLIDQNGKELEMPTGFDDFTEKAARDYPHNSEEAKKNMGYMMEVMVRCGFKSIRTEWWHFDDINAGSFPLLDIGLDAF